MKHFLILALLGLFSSSAKAADPEILRNLVKVASDTCGVPAKLHQYERYSLERFVGQAIDTSDHMLSTAFLVGYTTMRSTNRASGYCVCLFMSIPANPTWERGNFPYHLYEQALELKRLPDQVLDKVNLETGEITLKPFVPPTP